MVQDPQAKLPHWHYRLNHLGFKVFQTLAKFGLLPKWLSSVMPPKCAACIYGTAHNDKHELKQAMFTFSPSQHQPNEFPLTKLFLQNQDLSPIEGMVANFKIYSCHGVCRSFFMPQAHTTKNASSFETLEAKKAFEAYCNLYGHTICQHHCDNGPFAENAFLLMCLQRIS